MGVETKVRAMAQTAAEGYPLYLREREYSARIEKLLSRAVMLLASEADRRERAGDDVAHLRNFIKEARSA